MNNFRKFINAVIIRFRQINRNDYSWQSLDKTKLLVPFRLFAHPIDTFNDIKYEKRGSLALANLMLLIFFLEGIADYFLVGYLFSNNEPQFFNIGLVLVKTVVIVAVWCVTNWAMCTLLEGEGTFKDIWIATCYSLLPVILFLIPVDVISNVMTLSQGMFYSTFKTVIYGWTILLIFLGMMVVHQFSVSRTVGSTVLSIGMIVIMAFLLLLSFSIFQQMSAFVNTIITEIFRR